MKRILVLIPCMVACCALCAQGLNIGLIMPEEAVDGVAPDAFRTLNNKLERMITNSGSSAVNSGNIVIFPELNFNNDDIIEGGMRNIYSVGIELTAKVVSLSSNTVFGSISWDIKGKGYSKTEAVKEGFGKLVATDPKFKAVFDEIKDKICKYYISNKKAMLTQAKTLAAQQQYEEAIALLYEYPSGIDGYEEVQKALTGIFRQYQSANCAQALQEARALFAVQDYDAAAAIIADIDATSSCAAEARTLSGQIRAQIKSDQATEFERQKQVLQVAADVEKARLNAIAKVATAYYKSRPKVAYNAVIVKRW